MITTVQMEGVDLPLTELVPLHEREDLNIKTHRGFRRILSSIKSIGLIEPLYVYKENNAYIILDGYLRYRACKDLNIHSVPCIVHQDKEAYTFNRMVNRLSAYQEMRMLRKSLETIDEQTIADVFGMQTIQHRLAPSLLAQLHPKVAEAFANDLIGKTAAIEMSCVKPEGQLDMLTEMQRLHDYSPTIVRALILKIPPELRNPRRSPKRLGTGSNNKHKDLVRRFEAAEQQFDFYTNLYRQYSADLVKMTLYTRKIIITPELNEYLKRHHPATLHELSQIVLDLPSTASPA
jgi:hypothetical protein